MLEIETFMETNAVKQRINTTYIVYLSLSWMHPLARIRNTPSGMIDKDDFIKHQDDKYPVGYHNVWIDNK